MDTDELQPFEHVLADVRDVHEFFALYRPDPPTGWIYRGHADSRWTLLPKAGRGKLRTQDRRSLGRFYRWSRQAVAYAPDLPTNDWERLAVAQHFGLATCLLDWTFNPLAALYFACNELLDVDGAVHCFDPEFFLNDQNFVSMEQAECFAVAYIPRALTPRILNQNAVFTVHLPTSNAVPIRPVPNRGNTPSLGRLIVPATLKLSVLEMLNDYGVNSVTLFPDLEGLSRHINWETATKINKLQR